MCVFFHVKLLTVWDARLWCVSGVFRLTTGVGTTLLPTGCACRGTTKWAHVACLVQAALHDVTRWTKCSICLQDFTGECEIGKE